LTTALRILSFISENPVCYSQFWIGSLVIINSLLWQLPMQTVAASLYDEGAVTVIYAILVNCRFMLERSSNNYGKLITILVIIRHVYG
jgi:hypothetical protein